MDHPSEYFNTLTKSLHEVGISHPVLIIDLDRLDQNIDILLRHLPEGMGYRIVAKSLPVPKLISYLREKSGTDRLMTFNLPMLLDLIEVMPDAEHLIGKPLPARAFQEFLNTAPPNSFVKVHWLIDTHERFDQYTAIAQDAGVNAHIIIELDVGLHRGGFEPGTHLKRLLLKLRSSNMLNFKGFMGYEPHVASIPRAFGLQARAMKSAWAKYTAALDLAHDIFGSATVKSIVRNAAGSPTYRLYTDTLIANEVAVGSALVKPTHFDTELLKPFMPASFIATPVLKSVGPTQIPALEFTDGIRRLVSPGTAHTIFIHGGNWLADPVYPAGMRYNKTFGRSSNQEMLNGSKSLSIAPDDFAFFRPHQSEAVFLQFGDIVVIRGHKVVDRWPTFRISA